MSRKLQLDIVANDTLVANDFTPFSPRISRHPSGEFPFDTSSQGPDETEPLLGSGLSKAKRKPFYRARPLWIVPFAVVAAVVRGMTLAARVEVFTQLSCEAVHRNQSYIEPGTPAVSLPITHTLPWTSTLPPPSDSVSVHFTLPREDIPHIPSPPSVRRCSSDPVVQQGVAKLQVIVTTTMGLLSAVTNGFWGTFGEKYGRTRVLALVSLGLFFTDLCFVIVASRGPTSSTVLDSHPIPLLILAHVTEGLVGGWTALQSATSAYISDCTSPGSKAQIFARFTGVFYVGFSIGPVIGARLIKPEIVGGDAESVTSVFYMAVILSGINLFLVTFVFPESLSKEKQERARLGNAEDPGSVSGNDSQTRGLRGLFNALIAPMSVFLPVRIEGPDGRRRRDWNLTFIGAALLGFMLAYSAVQVKFLYGVHVYSWSAEQLGYYISFLGGTRALYLLIGLPLIISTFKPQRPTPAPGSSAAPTDFRREIRFDLALARLSLLVDMLGNALVVLLPSPHLLAASSDNERSQLMFVLASSLSGMGGGLQPAVQSLALCIMQSRASDSGQSQGKGGMEGMGKLFGAFAVLQALGQMILGPLMFGLVYGTTVASYPKAVFVTTATLLFLSFLSLFCVRTKRYALPLGSSTSEPPSMPARKTQSLKLTLDTVKLTLDTNGLKGKGKSREGYESESERRGRSRLSKDLRKGDSRSGSGSPAGAELGKQAGSSGYGAVGDRV